VRRVFPRRTPLQTQRGHEPLHRAPGHVDAFPAELAPHLAGSVDAEVVGVDPSDLDLELRVSERPARRRTAFAAWYVDGAIGSSAQIGSTP